MKEKVEEVVRKIINCRLLYYIAIILLVLGTTYLDLKARLDAENATGNHLKYFMFAGAIIGVIILVSTIFTKKLYKKVKPHIMYMILAFIIGGTYVFAIPLCAQSDEPEHLYRTFQVAKGEIISPVKDGQFTTELPKSIVDMVNSNSENKKREYKKYYDIKDMMKIPLNKEETVEIHTIGNYPGIIYFPQTIGVEIGLIFNLNPYFTAMLGRITGLIVLVLLMTYAIKKIPSHKLFASILLLSPVALSYCASFSADGTILACTALLISHVLYYRETKNKISKKDYVIFAILTIVLSISKIAYIPLIALLLFIPKECFEESKNKKIFSCIFILLGLITAITWMKITSLDVGGDPTNTNTWIYTNPFGYLIVLFRTTIQNAYFYIADAFAGHFLCHNQIPVYEIVPVAYIVIAIIAFFNDENKNEITMYQKIVTFGICTVSYVLISTAMYVYNTSFKSGIIIGVQGRYLLPLLLILVFFGNKKKLDVKEYRLTNIALIANYAVYLTMMTRFFI